MRRQVFRGAIGVCELVLGMERKAALWRLTAFVGSGVNRRYPRLDQLFSAPVLAAQLASSGIPVQRIEFNDGQCCVHPPAIPHYAGRSTETVVAVLNRHYPKCGELPMRWKVWDGEGI